MAVETRYGAFEGGALRMLPGAGDGRELVVGLPLNRLLTALVRVPAAEDAAAVAQAALQARTPFPDEALTVGLETVFEDERERVVLAAALPESSADDLGEALDAAKLNVVRIDALALGQLRGIWGAMGEGHGRRLVLMAEAGCVAAFVLDGDLPVAVRALDPATELACETKRLLLQAEDFGGARKLEEIVVVEGEDRRPGLSCEALTSLAPLRRIAVGEDAALAGVAERSAEAGTLDALPASWREVLEETRFKAKLVRNLAVAGGVWALLLAVLVAVPFAFGYLADYQKGLCRQHQRAYDDVVAMKQKTELVQRYSDHSRGALEIMKALSDRLPPDIVLSSWNFKRDEGVSVAGDAESADSVYDYKDALTTMGAEEDAEARVFGVVSLRGPTASRNGQRFDIDCRYEAEEVE